MHELPNSEQARLDVEPGDITIPRESCEVVGELRLRSDRKSNNSCFFTSNGGSSE